MKLLKTILASVALLSLTACAGSVKPHQGGVLSAGVRTPVKEISLTLTPGMQKKLEGNGTYDHGRFQQTITRALASENLVGSGNDKTLKVEVKDIRIRNAFNAIMFGFMAGNDHIFGTVSVVGKDGQVLRSFDVSASYALGGTAGGQNETRMTWLYEEFAKLTLKELRGIETVASKQTSASK